MLFPLSVTAVFASSSRQPQRASSLDSFGAT
jgi:hypothetical protein